MSLPVRELTEFRRVIKLIRDDCANDAKALDATSFTPLGVGTAFGNVLAMVDSLAGIVDRIVSDELAKGARP